MSQIISAGLDFCRDNPIVSFALLSVSYWIILSQFIGQTRKLKHISTIGYDNAMLSYLGALSFLVNAEKALQRGFQKWPGRMFKIAQLTEWLVVISNPESIEEVRKAPESVLSSMLAIDESLQVQYTLGENISANPYHIPIIRAQLTRALPELIPEVADEVESAFREAIPPTDDWISVKALDTMMGIIGRASNRVFVGLPLCRDPDYIKLNVQFTVDVVQTGAILHLAPKILRPIINFITSNVTKSIKRGVKHLAPIIQARRKDCEVNGDDASTPLDILTWLMDEAKGDERTDWNLTSRILTLNFAAIHTSSMTFTHALYYLATYPEYLKPLREEAEEIVKEEGWTKAGIDRMVKIDSFIKEAQRLRPLSSIMMQRVAMVDFKFSDGTTVPRGTTVSVAVSHRHMNPDVYPNPEKFDPFRFVKMKERSDSENSSLLSTTSTVLSSSKKFDMVATSCESLAFGHGRHACPGRYFAACELKLMLAHIVMNYDVRLEKEGVRPKDMWVVTSCVPNPTAEVMFRRRKI